jgi:hypothetical protein
MTTATTVPAARSSPSRTDPRGGGTVGDLLEDTTDTVGDVVGGVDDLLGGSGPSDGDGGLLGR